VVKRIETDNQNRIYKWNRDRQLFKQDYNPIKETSFVIEECIEGITEYKSEEAKEIADLLTKVIANSHIEAVIDFIKEFQLDKFKPTYEPTIEQQIDACQDIKVFTIGRELKLGYNPNLCLLEAIKHIESDKGYYNRSKGKWIKTQRTYEPKYETCKL